MFIINFDRDGAQYAVVGFTGFVRATLCTTSMVHDYGVHHWPALCTTDLHCAPLTYQPWPWWCTIQCCQSSCLSVLWPKFRLENNSYIKMICTVASYFWVKNGHGRTLDHISDRWAGINIKLLHLTVILICKIQQIYERNSCILYSQLAGHPERTRCGYGIRASVPIGKAVPHTNVIPLKSEYGILLV